MEKSKVFFTDLHTTPSSNLLDKMERLCRRAGIAGLDFSNPFTAIKIHFGEPGNLAYIRPNYAARMANLLRSLGAKPFLTDCNPLFGTSFQCGRSFTQCYGEWFQSYLGAV